MGIVNAHFENHGGIVLLHPVFEPLIPPTMMQGGGSLRAWLSLHLLDGDFDWRRRPVEIVGGDAQHLRANILAGLRK